MAQDKHDASFGDTTQSPRTVDAAGTPAHDGASITLHEERLKVGTEKVRASAVRFRTKVVTEDTTVTIPLRREVLEIIELDDDPDTLKGVKGLRKPREIVLHEERIAVETIAYERLRITREQVSDKAVVESGVRREILTIGEETL